MKVARQLVLYFVFGCTQFAVDTLLLVLFTQAHVPVGIANPASRACAAVLGLLLNYTITFRRGGMRGIGFDTVLRYVAFWGTMTLASTTLIALLVDLRPLQVERAHWIAFAKISVESMLFLVSFLVSRQWVYRTRSPR